MMEHKFKQTLVIAEDSPRDRELALEALSEFRVANEIVTVRDGAELLDYLHCRGPYADRPPTNPSFILLDLNMPRVGGLEALRQIRNDSKTQFIPVVVMTSSREEQDLVQSYKLGVNAYVVKPLDFFAFAEAVKNVGAFWTVHNEPPPYVTATDE